MSKLRGQRGEGTCQNGTTGRTNVHFSKVWAPPATLEGVKEVGEARSETTGVLPSRILNSLILTLFFQLFGLCSGCLGVPHPCSLSPFLTPFPFPSSHWSPFPPPPPPPGSLCPNDSCLESSARWAAHQLLALLHSFIWVKSCSRNVEGNGGVRGDRASWRAGIPHWAVQPSG